MGFWKPDSRPDDGVLCPSVKVEGLRVLQRERGDEGGRRQRKKKRERKMWANLKRFMSHATIIISL